MRLARIMSHLGRPGALVCATFLTLGAGIVANALFLQSGRHPAPLFSTRAVSGSPEVPKRDDLVEAIQAGLRQAGYYAGPVDGLSGPQTSAAIAAYERATGRARTGTASPELLASIRSPKTHEPNPEPALQPAASGGGDALPDGRVAAVQSALSRAAYGPLRPDGQFGPQTRDAIMRFQRDHGLPQTGEISDALLVELRAAGAIEGE